MLFDQIKQSKFKYYWSFNERQLDVKSIRLTSYFTVFALWASTKRVFSNVFALWQHSVGPVSGRDIIKLFKFWRCCEQIQANCNTNKTWQFNFKCEFDVCLSCFINNDDDSSVNDVENSITCATLDEFRLNVSFKRLNDACSLAINRCSWRNECAKSIISNKLPLSLIGCMIRFFVFLL